MYNGAVFEVRLTMSFWKRLFGGTSAPSADKASTRARPRKPEAITDSGDISEDAVEGIVLVVGAPRPSFSESAASATYKKINPLWSGKHRVRVLQSSEHLTGEQAVKACTALYLKEYGVPKGILLVQLLEPSSSIVVLFTRVQWEHPVGVKDKIVMLQTAIPFASA